jgi:tetratricopeptide (TPR) repeat protein
MARIYLSRGDALAASESIGAMEKLAPLIDESAVYYHTGILVGQSRNPAGFEQALAHSSSAVQRAVAHTYMAQYQLAINTLDHDGYDLPADRAFVYFRYGVYADSNADLQRALEFYKRAGDSRGIADSLLRLAAMSLQAGDKAGAQAYSQRALAVLTASGDTARAESVQAWMEAQL